MRWVTRVLRVVSALKSRAACMHAREPVGACRHPHEPLEALAGGIGRTRYVLPVTFERYGFVDALPSRRAEAMGSV